MLTDLQIEKLAKPTARREIPDGKIGGLYLVVQPSGAKSWALRYRAVGTPKKFTIGPYPAIGLAAARKRAQKALAEVVDGVDPSAQKKAAREAQKAADSTADRVETVVDAYVKDYLGKNSKPSWAKEAERLLRVEVVPKFGKKRTRGAHRRQHPQTAERDCGARANHRESDLCGLPEALSLGDVS